MFMAGRRSLYPVDSAPQVSPSDCKLAERWDKMRPCCNSHTLTSRQPIGIPANHSESANLRRMGSSAAYSDASQAELVRRACEGDKEAFYSLVRPCERAVYVAAMSIMNNAADAEEVAQEAVLKALAHLAGFRAEAKFSTWLIQITINEARSRLRKDRRHLYESIDEPRTDDEG